MKTGFTLSQTAGAKLESAANRTDTAGSVFEWMATGENMKQVAMLATGEYELKPIAQAVEQLLEDMEPVTVAVDQSIDFREVLKTTDRTANVEALWIDGAFAKILAKAKGSKPTSVSMKPRHLKRDAHDREIKATLPKEHELDPTVFCAVLATELSKVMRGERSDVFSKDRWCLFYVAGFAVYVRRDPDASKWYVHVWKLDVGQWRAGNVVFSCN